MTLPERPVPSLTTQQVSELSPGVRDLVVVLRESGFFTIDSGDGSNHEAGMECASPYRMVAIKCEPSQLAATADRLLEWIHDHEHLLSAWGPYRIEATYNPADQGGGIVGIFEATPEFLDQVEELTGERPTGLF